MNTDQVPRQVKGTTVLIMAIVIIAGILSVGAFLYAGVFSTNITNSAVQSIHTNAEVQASDMANLLSNRFETVASNLIVISESSAVQEGNVTAATVLLQSAQDASSSFTSDYGWIASNGTLLANSNQSLVAAAASEGLNVSTRGYFVGAERTGATYVSNATVTLLYHKVVVVVAQPVYSIAIVEGRHTATFEGVVASTVDVSSIGATIESELAPEFKSSIGLLDANGTVLYSASMNATGLNVRSAAFQALLPSGIREQFDAFLNDSLRGETGVQDLSYQGASGTIAYHPVLVETTPDNQTAPEFFGVMYVSAANVLEAGEALQVAQLRVFTELTILGIEASAVVAVFVVIRWNRRLDATVERRTADLAEKTSELARANLELASREETQRDFINIAAHELRTPVQPILGLTDLLRQSVNESGNKGTGEVSDKEVRMLERNVKRLEDLTRNILDVTKFDSGTFRLDKTRFDLNRKASEAIEEVGSVQPRRSSDVAAPSVRLSPSKEPLVVEADETRIFEVIANLLRNAIAFSKGSSVEVITRKDGDNAVLQVKDRGAGISTEVEPRLFTKFASKSENGLGLGLYISKKIIDAHGGKIWAENNADEGGGASFYIQIPIASPSAPAK